jgi:hypothetical protein
MNRTARGLCLCLAGLLVQPALAQQVYRWTDAEGVVHYTAIPPGEGQQAEQMKLKVPKGGPAAPAPAAPPQPGAQPGAGAAPAARAGEPAESPEYRREQCVKARANVERLQSTPGAKFRREDGSYQRYSAEERERMIAEAREVESEYCD